MRFFLILLIISFQTFRVSSQSIEINYPDIEEVKGDNGKTNTDDVYLRIKGKHIIEITNEEGNF